VSRLYNCSGWAVVYVLVLVLGVAVGAAGNLGIAVAILVPIWFKLPSAVVGMFETIVAVVGWIAITVGETVICAVARFLQRCRFFSAFVDVVLVAGMTCTV
jgi:hypothetical protein